MKARKMFNGLVVLALLLQFLLIGEPASTRAAELPGALNGADSDFSAPLNAKRSGGSKAAAAAPSALSMVQVSGASITDGQEKKVIDSTSGVSCGNRRATQNLTEMQVVYSNDFEGMVGSEWSNTSTDVTPIGARGFLGHFGNSTVSLALSDLPSHEVVTVSFDLFVIRSWDGNRVIGCGGWHVGPDIWDLSVRNGSRLLHTTFSNVDEEFCDSYMQAYPDSYPGYDHPPHTGSVEIETLGYAFDGHPADSVYELSATFSHSSDSLVLDFSASGLQSLSDESWGLDNIEVLVGDVASTPLTLNQPLTDSVGIFDYNYYHLPITAGLSLAVEVTPSNGSETLWLYSRLGDLPLWTHYDLLTQKKTPRGTYELLVSSTQDGVYYFSVYGRDVASAGGNFQIVARVVDRYLSDISPRSAGNAGEVTLDLSGLGFEDGVQVELRGTGLPTRAAEEVTLVSPKTLWARFDLSGAEPGVYDVYVVWSDSEEEELASAFEVTEGVGAQLEAHLDAPRRVRPGRQYVLWLEYANTGDADMVVPLLVVSSRDETPMRLADEEPFEDSPVQMMGIGPEGDAGRLAPGASNRIPIYFHVPSDAGAHQMLDFDLSVMISDTQTIDWDEIEEDVRPSGVYSDMWDALWPNLTAQIGTTWGDYRQTLADDAGYLRSLGRTVYDVSELFDFEKHKALGLNPRAIMAGRVDAYTPAPGLSLQFGRVFPAGLNGRFHLGPFGRGWTHDYDVYLEELDSGDILMHRPGSFTWLFRNNGDGTYEALPGDYGALVRTGDIFELTEKNGLVYRFRSDRQLDYIEEPNGNRITAVYDESDQLIEVQHSNGDRFTLEYNVHGHVSRLTDQIGRMIKYGYDATGEHLLTVTAPGNRVVTYTYSSPNGQPTDHALLSITYPDGTHRHYVYDDLGRLSEEYLGDETERISYTYDDSGMIHVKDAAGETIILSLDEQGRPLKVKDALGNELGLEYEADFTLPTLTGPIGQSYAFTYDHLGNVIGIENPSRQRLNLTYDTRFSQIASLEDARENKSEFDYDDTGNLLSLTYPDGSRETAAYDAVGNLITRTSHSGDVITHTHNDRGQLLRKDYPDGSWVAYTYDGSGNMTSASDVSGTITMEYDEDTDFLTRIAYPSGHYFEYDYNDAGQRTQRRDQDGHELNYEYDTAGRLSRLYDENDATIVSYEYDDNGRLSKETKGNGTYTTYEYDAAGHLLHMFNYAPDDTMQSRFDYTYDVNGNRTSMTTLEGTATYEYDIGGQLVGVTYPDSQHVTYEYDAAGNRVTITDDGTPTEYATNNLNQYTQVGDAMYTYDDNGNMISKTDAEGTSTYEYDAENRLIHVSTPMSGTWEYTYDALDNRVAVEHDGTVTRYIHDPIGFVNIAAEYDGSGTLVARYVHGLGLVARLDAAGNPAYYVFDATGHTRQMTDDAGDVANSYDYTPFGIPLQMKETIPNPFRYVGRYGVMAEENGLTFMRARYYDSNLGRFIAIDPISLLGGDDNLYSYVGNDPLSMVDPEGTFLGGLFLGGTAIGCTANTAAYLTVSRFTQQDITRGGVAGACVEGAISGAVTAWTGGDGTGVSTGDKH